jgi:cytochrome b6-f complex iron-sulfur subunit
MEKKKLTTEEILAAARKQAGGKPSESNEPAGTAPEGEGASGREGSAAGKPEPKPSPKSTADILAAARAQAASGPAGGGEKPSASGAGKGAGGPKSTSDILAAARAQAGGGKPAAAAAAKPKGAAGAAKKPSAAASATGGDRPSIQEMVRTAREGRQEEGAAGAPARVVPARAKAARAKPAAVDSGKEIARRGALLALLLSPFAVAWLAFSAASGLFTVLLLRFMMPNVLIEPPSTFKVGPPSDYPLGSVSTKWTPQFAVWVVHAMYGGRNIIYALSSVCTHLGCTPNWLDAEQKFKCPCHGSGFYMTGINFEGPAPRPLERHAISVAPDGMLEVDKSRKFQQEMGQWEDPASFVEVA